MQAGFIGLGAMGYGMATNVHRAGLLAAVFNRCLAVGERFAVDYGVRVVSSVAELAAQCDLVVTCVSADADVLDIVQSLAAHLQPGGVVVDCSTIAAHSARQAAAVVADAGGAFLDAPVSGGTEGASHGTLTIMVGGAADTLERVRPVLQAMGNNIVHMGPVGAGQASKAVNQVMAAGINQAVTEAMAFATALDLPLEKLVDVVGSGAAGNWFVNNRGLSMVRGDYAGFGFKLALHHKDLRICQAMATAAGGTLPLTQRTMQAYEKLMDAGHGDEDISALYRLQRQLFDAG